MKYFLAIFGMSLAMSLAVFWYWIAHKTTFWGSWARSRSPLIIFDFDGTICPSYPLFIDQVNFFADEYKLKKIESCETETFRNMTPHEIMKTLGVSPLKLPFLLRKARRNVQQRLLELRPVDGIVEVLLELKRRKYSLGILTSNSSENVLLYLQKHKIHFFDFIYTGNNVFGKEGHLKYILKKACLNPEIDLVIYVGDEVRDMDAAQKARFMSIGVTWGYNTSSLLETSSPDFLSKEPSQLLSFVDASENSFYIAPDQNR